MLSHPTILPRAGQSGCDVRLADARQQADPGMVETKMTRNCIKYQIRARSRGRRQFGLRRKEGDSLAHGPTPPSTGSLRPWGLAFLTVWSGRVASLADAWLP
eukprot:365314-Chlamydomonas_euryale.AAC.6